MNREHIRTWQTGRFRLDIYDTGRRDWRGQSKLAYEFRDSDRLIFQGEDFAGSPLHTDDSAQTVATLLSFLSLRPGDTDREYFASYTPEQLEWAQASGEELSWLATELEERTRLGFVPCTVESHFCAWLVTFDDGSTLLLQTDFDQAAFAVNCGVIQAPPDWDGLPSALGSAWADFSPEDIAYCPDDYRDLARYYQDMATAEDGP
jgi:hypothetical protein